MKQIPAIAQRRRQIATTNFVTKLEALETLLNERKLESFPERASVSSFATWEDPDLGVRRLSRSVIYSEIDEYRILRQRLTQLLGRVQKTRSKGIKKGNVELELRRQLELAEERAKDYVNQYSVAMAALTESRKEIERLKHQLGRRASSPVRSAPLRNTKS